MSWAVFVSGRGSNLAATLETVDVRLVVSSSVSCQAVQRARRAGVPVFVSKKADNWEILDRELSRYQVKKIFLAGYMRILATEFVEKWEGRIYNVHPSFLPEFPGLRSIERAVSANVLPGVTVHHVDQGVDTGEIIRQKRISDKAEQETQSIFQKVHVLEHQLVRGVLQCMM